MTGLDKITGQILEDAKAEAAAKVEAAKAQAEEILAAAQADTENSVAEIERKAAADVENLKQRTQSANDLHRRTEMLATKQGVIAAVIDKAYQKVSTLDSAAYFELMEKMVAKVALAKEGEICFNEADLARMPADFEAKANAAAVSNGGKLTLSKESKAIENGFVLIYDGIEENCTLRALFDSKKSDMQDTVYALLFRKEA